MKTKRLLAAFTLGLILISYIGPAVQAMPAQLPVESALPVQEAPAYLPPAIHHSQLDALPMAADAASEAEQVPEEIASVPGATDDWWAGVQEQIQQDMYAISSDAGLDPDPAHHGSNPAHNFDLAFAADGVQLSPRQVSIRDGSPGPLRAAELQPAEANVEEQWKWGLRFTGYGYTGNVQPVSALVELVAVGSRVEYRYETITEWYVNDSHGLEQGFTISAPPSGEGQNLILAMALDTDLAPMLSGDAQAIDFVLPGGNVVLLRYSELYVTDATGRQLSAHLSGDVENEIRIVIDDADAAYPLIVDPLITADPWTAIGEDYDNFFGGAVGTAGDVNGDGYDDVVIGATRYDGNRGKVYVYYGSASGLGDTPWTDVGGAADRLGVAVGTAGDVNGDGYDDVVVSAEDASTAGKAYVYHGSASGLIKPASWEQLGEGWFECFGCSARTAGDVNSDGFDDLIVGARYHDLDSTNINYGKAYVYYGSAAGLSTTPDWIEMGTGTWDLYGTAVGTAGDVNGDGYDDVVIGAPGSSSDIGSAYVYLGTETGLDAVPIWTGSGTATWEYYGSAVGTAGDVNGDGFADFAIGASGFNVPQGADGGKVWVYYGALGETGWSAIGVGESAEEHYGWSLGTAGDVNGDGFSDVVVGAYGHDGSTGRAYVYHGSPFGLDDSPAWVATGEGVGDAFARAVGPAGDVNGDGYDDLVIGAQGHDGSRGRMRV